MSNKELNQREKYIVLQSLRKQRADILSSINYFNDRDINEILSYRYIGLNNLLEEIDCLISKIEIIRNTYNI